MDQARDQEVGEFDEEAEVLDFGHDGVEGLSGSGLKLVREEFEFFEANGFLFGFGGGAFGLGEVFPDSGERFGEKIAAFLFGGKEGTVDNEVGVASDGRGEVGVVGFSQAIVAERFGLVVGPFQGFEEPDFKGVVFG